MNDTEILFYFRLNYITCQRAHIINLFTINKYLLFHLPVVCKKDIINSVRINSCHYVCKAIMYCCIEIITIKFKKATQRANWPSLLNARCIFMRKVRLHITSCHVHMSHGAFCPICTTVTLQHNFQSNRTITRHFILYIFIIVTIFARVISQFSACRPV